MLISVCKNQLYLCPDYNGSQKTAPDGYGRPAFLAERVKIDGGQ
jgi:hypothetical protein